MALLFSSFGFLHGRFDGENQYYFCFLMQILQPVSLLRCNGKGWAAMGKVGKIALSGLAAFAVTVPEQNTPVGFTFS